MPEAQQTVFIVDDREVIRDSLRYLLNSVEIATETFGCGQAVLDAIDLQWRGCMILDIRLPDMNGLDLARKLREREIALPIIFITAHADVPLAVEAMRQGALDFIEKPFRDQDILDRAYQAFELDTLQQRTRRERNDIGERLEQLTPRERDLLELIVAGMTNKAIAIRLHLSLRTVEHYRATVMKKMDVRTAVELVQQFERARGQ